jgi:hypothetical protein
VIRPGSVEDHAHAEAFRPHGPTRRMRDLGLKAEQVPDARAVRFGGAVLRRPRGNVKRLRDDDRKDGTRKGRVTARRTRGGHQTAQPCAPGRVLQADVFDAARLLRPVKWRAMLAGFAPPSSRPQPRSIGSRSSGATDPMYSAPLTERATFRV